MNVCYRVVVSGRVQGVYYRDSCRKQAEQLGLSGWVRNLEDGDVEVFVEGPPRPVAQLLRWCREGPPQAHVTGVKVEEAEPAGAVGFRVSR